MVTRALHRPWINAQEHPFLGLQAFHLVDFRAMLVSVLIATRERPEALRRCVASVARQTYADLELLVWDDASTPPVQEALVRNEAGRHPARCFRSDERLGPMGCRNGLMQHARGEVFIVLDDDACLADAEAITQVVRAFEAYPRAGILAFKIVERCQGKERMLVPHRRRRVHRDPRLIEQEGLVSHYLAGGHALRRRVIEQVGYFHEGLYYGHEELDLSYRTLDAGFEIRYLPRVLVYHLPETEASRIDPWKLYYSIRNRLLTVYRYLPWRYVPTHVGFWLFLYGWQALRQTALGAYGRGVWAGLAATRRFHRHPIKPETVAYLKAHGGRLWY